VCLRGKCFPFKAVRDKTVVDAIVEIVAKHLTVLLFSRSWPVEDSGEKFVFYSQPTRKTLHDLFQLQ
jgi:hypothetical protein